MKKIIVAAGVLAINAAFAHAAYFNATPLTQCSVQITNTLSTGSRGSNVLILQNILARAGYLDAAPNGNFGPATRAAVRAFQADNGLVATGTVGQATINALNERACDQDARGDGLVYDSWTTYGSGTTYVDAYDPYATVVTPRATNPVIFNNPGVSYVSQAQVPQLPSVINSQTTIVTPSASQSFPTTYTGTPATTVGGATSNISYSPYVGYYYGAVPTSGSLTITSPVANAVYNEGDTINVAWYTSHIQATEYQVVLENTQTGLRKDIATVGAATSQATIVLSKEFLDAVCAGTCDANNQASFRIVVTTPMKDIAGNVSPFRAAVSPITIKRPAVWGWSVSIMAGKNPVNSGETFRLYVNIPTGASWNSTLYGNYSFKIRAICPAGVAVTIAGTPCGQEFVVPFAPVYMQQELPAMITNTTWYKHDVIFELTVTDLAGRVIGSQQTTVTSNPAPFAW